MSDEGQNLSRLIGQVVMTAAAAVSFALTGTPVWLVMSDLLRDVSDVPPRLLADAATVAGISAGVIAATLTVFAIRRIHRSLWPEHPNEE
jgi:sulfite exporter TauE/SafE